MIKRHFVIYIKVLASFITFILPFSYLPRQFSLHEEAHITHIRISIKQTPHIS
ncbi:hypothetical protein HanRHA438_Chr04g0171721 [Helianthus annuus]|nr:hypothetical protein HanRHA438_Chr04g0171721 [Helianthus annuus]